LNSIINRFKAVFQFH